MNQYYTNLLYFHNNYKEHIEHENLITYTDNLQTLETIDDVEKSQPETHIPKYNESHLVESTNNIISNDKYFWNKIFIDIKKNCFICIFSILIVFIIIMIIKII